MNQKIPEMLRMIAVIIDREIEEIQMPHIDSLPDEEPFVDAACEAIEHGGPASGDEIATLLYYIADAIEKSSK